MSSQTALGAHLSDVAFSQLDLHPQLQQAVAELGFELCTPIQAQSLPEALAGRSVAGQAKTGTGKTAAFLLATMHRLLSHEPDERRKDQPRAFILAPTRELAIQIHKDAVGIGKHTGFRLGLAYGGAGYDSQREQIGAGVDILIGTPGRLIDYYKQKVFDLRAIEVCVLDEADRMFDLGFIKDIRYLLRRMSPPEARINMLYSATLSQKVLELAYEHMGEPKLVRIEADTLTADRARQRVYHVANEDKLPMLLGILKNEAPDRCLIFCNTKRDTERVCDTLSANGHEAGLLSGDVAQTKRLRMLKEFSEGKLRHLVATDVAARGLHIPEVSHVINYDLPQDCEDYVHRIGRTARAGAAGEAISMCCESYVYSLPDIEAYVGHKLPVESFDENLMVRDYTRAPRRARRPGGPGGRRNGQRSSGSRPQGGQNRSGGRRRGGRGSSGK